MTDFVNIRPVGRKLQLVCSDYTKTKVKTISKFAPYILSTKVSRYPEVRSYVPEKQLLFRHYMRHPHDTYDLKDRLQGEGHKTFEHDILYKFRYLIDAGIYCKMPSGPVMVFDIETLHPHGAPRPRQDPIVAISWATDDGAKGYIGDGTEAAILKKFEQRIAQIKPTVLTGYNIFNFDLPYIETRLGRNLCIPGEYYKRLNKKTGKYEYDGFAVQLVDLYLLARRRTRTMPDYKLDTVCRKLFGIGKTDTKSSTEELIAAGTLKMYSLRDAEITMMLWEYFAPLLAGLVEICGYPVQEVAKFTNGQFVEMYLVRKAVEQGMFVPNKNTMEHDGYEGGYVREPTKGLYRDFHSFDFKSLYPNIIIDRKISPHTPGLINVIMKDLIEYNESLKPQIKKARGRNRKLLQSRYDAVKIVRNSFYGYMGWGKARWFDLEAAAEICEVARHRIHEAELVAEAAYMGLTVIYGDTDSLYIKGDNIGEFKKWAAEHNMGYDGHYAAGIFFKKKKYVLKDTEGELTIKGFEYRRRDWCELAKDTQRACMELILDQKAGEAKQLVRSVCADLFNHVVPLDKVIIRKQLNKTNYHSESVPHFEAALRGGWVDKKTLKVLPNYRDAVVEYIVTYMPGIKKVSARTEMVGRVGPEEIDSGYYVYSQVVPAVMRLFECVGISEMELLQKQKQSTLGAF